MGVEEVLERKRHLYDSSKVNLARLFFFSVPGLMLQGGLQVLPLVDLLWTSSAFPGIYKREYQEFSVL